MSNQPISHLPSSISGSEAAFKDPIEEAPAPALSQVMSQPPASGFPTENGKRKTENDLHQEAFDFDPHWQGKPLEAFTFARQSLAAMLHSQCPGIGDGYIPTEAYMPPIWAVLYLCTHKPEEFRALRSNPGLFWETIEAWAEHGLNEGDHPGCPREQWVEASLLVNGSEPSKEFPDAPYRLGLWKAARTNVVSIRHRPGSGRLGNDARQSVMPGT